MSDFFEIILEYTGGSLSFILLILLLLPIVGAGYLLLKLVRGIIKFVIKEFKKMSDEVDVEIKESKEKKGE